MYGSRNVLTSVYMFIVHLLYQKVKLSEGRGFIGLVRSSDSPIPQEQALTQNRPSKQDLWTLNKHTVTPVLRLVGASKVGLGARTEKI